MNYTIKNVHISTIKAGDTVEHNGEMMTVCNSNIKRSDLFGATLFGDSYSMGYKLVKKIEIVKAI